MLPSTGYFKAINCPFYESGSCERPYCHFKHAKREDAATVGGSAGAQEARAANQAREAKVSTIAASNTDVLQQLVTEAVKKVLANREVTDTDSFSENVVCQVVEGLKPSLTPGAVTASDSSCASVVGKRIEVPIQIAKPVPCVYNPTPIAELKKRHIPIVSYMPTRETRVTVKRKSSPDASKAWLGVASESASAQVPEVRYKPTAITTIDDGDSSCNYVPTYKSDSTISSSYEDTNSDDYLLKLREEYYPKSKKRREEYIPKKVKAPLKTIGGVDEPSLDQFGSEFPVVDKIITTARAEPCAVSCENSQDSCFELEPKFSDDEEIEHRNECDGPTDENSEVENVAIDGNNGDSRIGMGNGKDDNDDDDDDNDDGDTNVEEDESTRLAIKENKSIREEKAKLEGVCIEDKHINRADSKDETKRVIDVGYKLQKMSTSRSPRRENTEGKDKTYSDERNRRSSNKRRSRDRNRSNRDKKSRENSKDSQKRERDSNAEEKRHSESRHRSRERSRSKKCDRAQSDSYERKDSKRHKKERTVESKDDRESKDRRREKDYDRRKDRDKDKERKKKDKNERGNERESNKDSSLSIKKEDREKKKKKDRSREDRKRTSSRTTHKSNDESCKNLKVKKYEKNDGIRKRTKSSGNRLEGVRFVRDNNSNSMSGNEEEEEEGEQEDEDDDEDEEDENYQYRGQIDNGNENNEEDVENDDDDDDDLVLSLSDSDHDVHEECLKIFQEYQVPEQSTATSPAEWKREVDDEQDEIGRKRVAHPSAAANVTRQQGPNRLTAGKKLSNPQQKMYERWRLMREVAAAKAAEKAAAEKAVSVEGKSSGIAVRHQAIRSIAVQDGRRCKEMRGGSCAEGSMTACNSETQLNGNGNGRVRIAHVPYARSLAMEKRLVAENAGKTVAEAKTTDSSKTAAQTAKSGVRVAHIPQVVPQLIRPEPLQVSTQKFSLSVRQYFVNMMHDVCVQIYTNAEDAAQRAVKEEFSCHERCKTLPIYKNLCMLAAHRLRKEVDQALPSEMVNASASVSRSSAASGSGMVSHEAVLAGKSKGSWSVLETKRSVMEFKGTALYSMMKKWILTEQQLQDNGFPRPHPDGQKGRAKVYVTNSRNQNVLSKVPNERVCGRCGQTYAIDKQGFAVRQENCIYHWGRKFTFRGESRYSCCRQDGSASGCCDAKTHVWDYTDYENLRGYVRTLPKATAPEKQGVYALDCEMSYTTQGLELTRVTVIDDDCNVVYEALVKPQNPVIDYNTRFSGITEEIMKNVTTTLLDVQATLLTMFSDKTILVGHSLESDFSALRLLHDTVVDTSVMFPHKNGYPQKRALKNLCSDYLRKIIQNDVGGHDSKEDAVACMELILWKAKEEAKLQ